MFHLKRNLPSAERAVRLGLAACLAFATYRLAPTSWVLTLGFASAALLACSAAIGFCPACALFGRRVRGPR